MVRKGSGKFTLSDVAGLSDPVSPAAPPTVAQWVNDAVAVLDANEVERVDVLANADTSMVTLLLAARFPARVRTLTLVNGYARFTSVPGYPFGVAAEEMSRILRGIHTPSDNPPVDVLTWRLPSAAGDPRFRSWWDAVGRRGASPRTASLAHRAIVEADVRDAVGLVTCPVLLLSRLGCASYDPGARPLPRGASPERHAARGRGPERRVVHRERPRGWSSRWTDSWPPPRDLG
ncbi:MAG: alpha/beta hydrolase [Lapillicoccus sp.]